MGIGHLAVAFASKRAAPRVSLGLLIFAAMFVDVLWAGTVGLGIEHVRIEAGFLPASPFDLYDYPVTHSLVAALGWAAAFGAVYLAFARDATGAVVLAGCVASHWALDLVAHRPDLPVLPHGPYVGLGLWYSLPGTLVVEALMVALGLYVYLGATRPRDRVGSLGLAGLAAFLGIVHLVVYLGPPPPSVAAISVSGAVLCVPMLAAHWVDRHRAPVTARA